MIAFTIPTDALHDLSINYYKSQIYYLSVPYIFQKLRLFYQRILYYVAVMRTICPCNITNTEWQME